MKQKTAALLIVGAIALSVASASAEEVPADNSGKNVRDRADSALTSGDQSNSAGDVAITAALRKAVVDDPKLSVNAQNVKIITVGGVVTLRGPVATPVEKESVASKAREIVGVTKVDNQLEIASE
jgi:hyperosmotically inducible protein